MAAGSKEAVVTGELKSDEAASPKGEESKAKTEAPAAQGEETEIKPSVWEKFMEKKAK